MSEGEDFEMGVNNQMQKDGMSGMEFGRMALQGEKTWTQYDQDGVKGGRTGPVRRTTGEREEDKQKKDRLEREFVFINIPPLLSDPSFHYSVYSNIRANITQTAALSTGNPPRNTVLAEKKNSKS